MNTRPYGFHVMGSVCERRWPVDWQAAFVAYAACDPRAKSEDEAYLSHFVYGRDFDEYLNSNRTEKGYDGPCGAIWLFFDIDRKDDLNRALHDARLLAAGILDRYPELDDNDLLIFWSGEKGFHLGLPTSLWRPTPSRCFHEIAERFCLAHAERAGVVIDRNIYSKVRLFRPPNSRHPMTNLYKRRLAFNELMNLNVDGIVELARQPMPFHVPAITVSSPTAATDWQAASETVERHAANRAGRRPTFPDGSPKLNALTLAFIREGALEGEREVRLFQAAANLAELGCPAELAHALLFEVSLDSGLTPSETRKGINDGASHGQQQRERGAS
jgi:hypothetical protein